MCCVNGRIKTWTITTVFHTIFCCIILFFLTRNSGKNIEFVVLVNGILVLVGRHPENVIQRDRLLSHTSMISENCIWLSQSLGKTAYERGGVCVEV